MRRFYQFSLFFLLSTLPALAVDLQNIEDKLAELRLPLKERVLGMELILKKPEAEAKAQNQGFLWRVVLETESAGALGLEYDCVVVTLGAQSDFSCFFQRILKAEIPRVLRQDAKVLERPQIFRASHFAKAVYDALYDDSGFIAFADHQKKSGDWTHILLGQSGRNILTKVESEDLQQFGYSHFHAGEDFDWHSYRDGRLIPQIPRVVEPNSEEEGF